LCLRNGDEGEDGGEAGGEQRERILFLFSPFSSSLGQGGSKERAGAVP
jgi:hypothetical protein